MTNPIRVGIEQEEVPATDIVDDSPVSILDELREELAQAVDIPNLYLPVPNRETIRMVYRPAFDLDDLKKWRKIARDKPNRSDSEINQKKFMYLVLSSTCVGMQLKRKNSGEWVDITDPSRGTAWTFQTAALSEYLGCVPGWYATVEAMYRNDGHIVMTAKAIMDEAGFGDYDLEAGDDGPLDG